MMFFFTYDVLLLPMFYLLSALSLSFLLFLLSPPHPHPLTSYHLVLYGNCYLTEVCAAPSGDAEREVDHFLSLQPFVDEIREIQHGQSIAVKRTGKTDFSALIAWLSEHDAFINKVNVSQFDGFGNGLCATEFIQKGDDLVKIPEKCMISEITAAQCPRLGKLVQSDQMLSAMPNVALAFHLLSELLSENSFWQPYIACLPSMYSLPFLWSREQLMSLKGTSIFLKALRLSRHILRQYCYLFGRLCEKAVQDQVHIDPLKFTLDDYRWAVATVMSRQNSIPIKRSEGQGVSSALALIPLWDIANHRACEATTGYNLERHQLEFAAPMDTAKDGQVFMHYGERNNAEYVLYQGFFYTDLSSDYMTFPLDVPEDVDHRGVKQLLLKNLQIIAPGEFVLSMDAALDAQLLAFARVCCMSKDQLAERLRSPAMCGSLGVSGQEGVVDPANERAALDLLRRVITELQSNRLEASLLQQDTSAESALASKLRQREDEFILHTLQLLTTTSSS
eukprot:m.54103 g.54103  ORF g.54103 m.54103 type:complete len:506 (+) comp12844_c1_seq2:135-1652(+)